MVYLTDMYQVKTMPLYEVTIYALVELHMKILKKMRRLYGTHAPIDKRRERMSDRFESIEKGLKQAIEYKKGRKLMRNLSEIVIEQYEAEIAKLREKVEAYENLHDLKGKLIQHAINALSSSDKEIAKLRNALDVAEKALESMISDPFVGGRNDKHGFNKALATIKQAKGEV